MVAAEQQAIQQTHLQIRTERKREQRRHRKAAARRRISGDSEMNISRSRFLELVSVTCLLAGSLFATSVFAAVTVNVVDNDGVAVDGFRWLLQEDTTFAVDPTAPATNPDDLLSLSFHASHHPVAQSGNVDTGPASITATDGRYYVSVLPYSGYSISGQQVEVVGGNASVDVTVQKHPIPTTQIAVYLFHDSFPLNGAPDLPEEANPASGDPGHVDFSQFTIFLEEPAGQYGISGGQVIQDAFGNPLGTSYQKGCDADGNPDPGPDDPTTNYGCLDGDGAPIVTSLGDGTLATAADGTTLIENLAPGKYGVVIIPPTDSGWQQTSTIEGSKVIDAWVKANEPPFFVEFGPPGPHVFVGFTQEFNNLSGGGTATVSGTITDMHMSRPPNFEFFSGRPFPGCWVAVNEAGGADPGAALYAGPCDESDFSIPNVAEGSYQLKVFDTNLDAVIASQGFTVDGDGANCNAGLTPDCDFGEVAVFNWFARLNTGVFTDTDQDGFWDNDETGVFESQDVTIRWRDGTIYQNFAADGEGFAPFDEVFPFFHWLVAEVSFAFKKATGATYVVDAGGEIPPPDPSLGGIEGFPSFGELTPQPQSENGGADFRTETGAVLTNGFQGFLGQTSVMHFGKVDYVTFDFSSFPITYVGENGGISGIVYYATTRAEHEPQFAAAEEWEPGIPRVQVNLYVDGDIDVHPLGDFPGIGDVDWNEDGTRDLDDDAIDDVDGDGFITLADVDNYPLGDFPSTGDVDHNSNGIFDLGDAVQVTWTDSWDDSLPTDCQGANNLDGPAIGLDPVADDRCFDGLRNFNQVRPATFDGGYAFADYDLDHLAALAGPEFPNRDGDAEAAITGFYTHINGEDLPPLGNYPGTEDTLGVVNDPNLQLGLIPGDYIVEAVTPPSYKLMKEEDKNVDFGDEYIPSPQAFAAYCVGDLHEVPPLMTMTTKDGSGAIGQIIAGIDPDDAAAPFAGEMRPLCDRKKVPLSAAQNAAAEYWLFTDVPPAGNVTGVILNDFGNEFNPNSPAFGEKYAPPNVPVGFYDWNGKEVGRVYADFGGRYNLMVPSTFTTNLPQPSGMSPNMLISCMNDAGTGDTPDPFWNPQFSQFCYTFQYMPGTATYLDTPVEPIAAFASPITYPVDCEMPTTTPVIASVTRDDDMGPYALPGETILVNSMGMTAVDNPDWDGTLDTDRKIPRDYSFNACTVELEAENGVRTPLAGASCAADQASGQVPSLGAGAYQVVVTNSDGAESPIGVTLTVGPFANAIHRVPGDADTIQGAIDGAANRDLILVAPGQYNELVIMYKAVKLQGWGAGAVTINARQSPTDTLNDWRTKTVGLEVGGDITRLPGQELGVPGFPALSEALFPTEEGAAIFVAGTITRVTGGGNNIHTNFSENPGARIDGFNIIGASTGGGVIVNGFAESLLVGNNRVTGNAGAFGGGVRVGHPTIFHEDPDTGALVHDDALNDDIRIHHNHIAMNGGRGGAGGGLSLHTGADNYVVEDNRVCANFSSGNGAGIGHLGLSDNGTIENNTIMFNESFAQADARAGGGIFIGGKSGLEIIDGLLLSPGTGDVTVDSNVIRGNLAGAGDGGGIQLAAVNGRDIAEASGNGRGQWNHIRVINNMINNNVAGLAGGGISMQDAVRVTIDSNTVAHNETTATAAAAFAPGGFNQSNATPAGIVARTHSTDFAVIMGTQNGNSQQPQQDFSNADISNSIIEHNRSFFWLNFDDGDPTNGIDTGLFPADCVTAPLGCDLTIVENYTSDFAVMDGPFTIADPITVGELDPQSCLLSDTVANAAFIGSNGNVTGDPGFVNGYFNGALGNIDIQEFTTISTAGAFDEGGNFIQVAYSPLSLINSATGDALDYHIGEGAAVNAGDTTLGVDIDDETRPQRALDDIGADEIP